MLLDFSEIREKVIDAIDRRDFEALEILAREFGDPSKFEKTNIKEIIIMGFERYVFFCNLNREKEMEESHNIDLYGDPEPSFFHFEGS